MENNLVETQKQVFCAPGTETPLCVDSHGIQVPQPVDASVVLELAPDSGTIDDALESEPDSSEHVETPMFDGASAVTMMVLGAVAFGVVVVFFKKVF